MRILLVVLVCALLTGCGLFKKTKRIDRQLDAVEVSKDVQVKTDIEAENIDKSKTEETRKEESEGSTKIYPKPGTHTTVSPDGSVTGEIDSVVNNVKKKTDAARNIAADLKETLRKKSDSIALSDSTGHKETYNLDKVSKPDGVGILSNYIGWAILIVILLAFPLWYFGVRRKKQFGK